MPMPMSMSMSMSMSMPMSMSMSMLMSISTVNSVQINVNLLLGQQKWSCLFANRVNDNLPSIGILLNQTLNLYLVTGQVPGSIQKEPLVPAYMSMFPVKRQVRSKEQFEPFAYVLLSVKRQVRSKEQFAPTYMLWY
jgi:hypothetical protein